jgi:hypothetical protein
MSPSLTVMFANGDAWLLEVPRPNKKQAQQVVSALTSEGLRV